jgi:hypothetical protein
VTNCAFWASGAAAWTATQHVARLRAAELTTGQIIAAIRGMIGSRRHNFDVTLHGALSVARSAATVSGWSCVVRSPCAHPSMSTPQRVASSASPWS